MQQGHYHASWLVKLKYQDVSMPEDNVPHHQYEQKNIANKLSGSAVRVGASTDLY
jgi:hypothetical protein